MTLVYHTYIVYISLLCLLISACSNQEEIEQKPPIEQERVQINHPPIESLSLPKSDPICENREIMKTLAMIKIDSPSKCFHQAEALSRKFKIEKNTFLNLIKNIETKTIFFFNKNQTDIDDEQWDEKKQKLLNNIILSNEHNNTLFINNNTLLFIISKSSKNHLKTTEYDQRLRELLSYREKKLISKIIKASRTDHPLSRGYIDSDAFQIHSTEIKDPIYQYLNESDVKRAQKFNENIDDYINQSVLIFTYPCLKEMCSYMKNDLHLDCDTLIDANCDIPECIEPNKNQSKD